MMPAVGQWYGGGMKTSVVFLLLVVAAGAVGAWGAEVTGASPLLDALSFVPAAGVSTTVFFTDWSVLKSYIGFDEALQQNAEDAEKALASSLGQGQAAASAFGANHPEEAALWGWRSSDLEWEANFTNSSGIPVYVLRFASGFQFGALMPVFEQRGFTQTESHGVLVYSHPLDLQAEWLVKSELAILNTAVVAEDGLLVLSSSAAALDEVLSAYREEVPTLSADAAAQAVAGRLQGAASAILVVGPGACWSLSADPALASFINASDPQGLYVTLKALLTERADLHVYTGFGVGYHYDGKLPIGAFVFHFLDPASASLDLPLRQALAESGASTQGGQLYSQVVFTVTAADVEGSDLIITVRPVGDEPRRLFQMVFARDMLFALCP